MIRYRHILLAIASEVWAIDPVKLHAIVEFAALQAAGTKFSAEEIEARIAPQTAAAVSRREGAIAVVPIRGVIANRMSMMSDISGGCSAEAIARSIDQLAADDGVKTVVLDVSSPGGSAQGVDELAAVIDAAKAKKPIIAQVNGDCASAAFWAVAPCSEIVLTASSRIGSVGAMSCYDDISKQLDEEGVNREIIVSSPFKGELAGGLALSDEARAALQAQVDAYGAMFETRVAKSRGVPLSEVKSKFGMGRMVIAEQAIAAGMADRIGTMAETLARFGAKPVNGPGPSERPAFASARETRRLRLPH